MKYSFAWSCTSAYAGSRSAGYCALPSLGFIKLYQLPRADYLHTNKQTNTYSLWHIAKHMYSTHPNKVYTVSSEKYIFGQRIYVKWWIFKFGALHKLLKLGNFQVSDSRVWVNYNNCTTWINAVFMWLTKIHLAPTRACRWNKLIWIPTYDCFLSLRVHLKFGMLCWIWYRYINVSGFLSWQTFKEIFSERDP